MAIHGVVGGMQGADAPLLAESVGGIPRGLCPDHTVEDDPGAGFMNTVTKYMVSRTLTKVDWNNSTLLEGELAVSVPELKESDGGEITTSGSSTLVRSLLDLKRLDELDLLAYRVIVGRGKRLAEGNARPASSGTDQIHRLRQSGQPPALSARLLSDLACSSSLTSSPSRAVTWRPTSSTTRVRWRRVRVRS